MASAEFSEVSHQSSTTRAAAVTTPCRHRTCRSSRDLGIYIDSDVSMRSHIMKTVSACFFVLRQLRSIRRSEPDSVCQSLVVSLVLMRHWPTFRKRQHLIRRLQSVMNAAARLNHSASRYQRITPLLRQLHWLKAQEQINFKLAVLVFKCLHGMAPPYLADEFVRQADS